MQVRDSGLLDARLTTTAVDLVFQRVKGKVRLRLHAAALGSSPRHMNTPTQE